MTALPLHFSQKEAEELAVKVINEIKNTQGMSTEYPHYMQLLCNAVASEVSAELYRQLKKIEELEAKLEDTDDAWLMEVIAARDDLQSRLAEIESQKPIGHNYTDGISTYVTLKNGAPLYAYPVATPALSDADIVHIWATSSNMYMKFARAIEAAVREKI